MRLINDLFHFWNKTQMRYEKLKENPDKQPVSTRLGVSSIISSVLGLVLLAVAAWCASLCFNAIANSESTILFAIIGLAACCIGALVIFIVCTLRGLACFIYQRKLNKRAIGTVAAIIWALCLAASIVFAVLIFIAL